MSSSDLFAPTIVKRPFIPFCEVIPFGTQIGSYVTVKGRVPRFANQFVINLIVGQQVRDYSRYGSDIALRFNPRIDEEVVLKNCRIGHRWGLEERQRRGFPFARNQWFELKILARASYYKIYIDGQAFTMFLHRIPAQYVGIFCIEGDVELESIVFDREYSDSSVLDFRNSRMIAHDTSAAPKSPSPTKFASEAQIKQQIDHNLNIYASQHSIIDNMVLSQKTIYNPPLPFSQFIINGLKSGMIIIISGVFKESARNFNVTLQRDSSDGVPDVALDFDVLFRKKSIVRKCRVNGEWLHEETDLPCFPFKTTKSEYFEIKLEVESNLFAITVNGKHLSDYVTRVGELGEVNTLDIRGDASVIYVTIDACEVN